MIFLSRSTFLTCNQVAEREGISRQGVARMCRLGQIFPIIKHGRGWLIEPSYVIATNSPIDPLEIGRSARRGVVHKKRRGYGGRPKGSKNKNPYPVGVKRPRKSANRE